MAPTSDERREVAARLRAYPLELVKTEHKCKDPLQLPADVMYDLMDIAGVGEDFDSLLPALADLIDPTCHMTREYADTELGRVFQGWLCDECMCTADVLDASEPPEYCPHCGARVTRGGDE